MITPVSQGDEMVYEEGRSSLLRRMFIEHKWQTIFGSTAFIVVASLLFAWFVYTNCRIDVPGKHFAVLTLKEGKNQTNDEEVAMDEFTKGIQLDLVGEGRFFYSPYHYDWNVYPQVEIPDNKMGVRTRLYGNDLGYGDFMAVKSWVDDDIAQGELPVAQVDKGIIKEVLRPARYNINALVIDGKTGEVVGPQRPLKDYVEIIELWSPKIIPAGYRGIVTNLSGPIPADPNQLLVGAGDRGPQEATLGEGTYYINPYEQRINAIDTRSQRFNLSGDGYEMGFPSKDGFWIELEGVIEFRVKPETAATTYVLYNDDENDTEIRTSIAEEIIAKVILPNARAFCRLRGSNSSGREFIGGETRTAFQLEFQEVIAKTCDAQGIEIVQALITRIKPPEKIAGPVRDREIARLQEGQFNQQKNQQTQEALLATQRALIVQRSALVDADKIVIKAVTLANQEQGVAKEKANQEKEVAIETLEAAKDQAEAIMSRARADAAVVGFENEADAAGWKRAVTALGGNGQSYADYVMFQKMAPGFQSIMTNTADSKFMQWFENFGQPQSTQPVGPVEGDK